VSFARNVLCWPFLPAHASSGPLSCPWRRQLFQHRLLLFLEFCSQFFVHCARFDLLMVYNKCKNTKSTVCKKICVCWCSARLEWAAQIMWPLWRPANNHGSHVFDEPWKHQFSAILRTAENNINNCLWLWHIIWHYKTRPLSRWYNI
jgi:hypothetical protein